MKKANNFGFITIQSTYKFHHNSITIQSTYEKKRRDNITHIHSSSGEIRRGGLPGEQLYIPGDGLRAGHRQHLRHARHCSTMQCVVQILEGKKKIKALHYSPNQSEEQNKIESEGSRGTDGESWIDDEGADNAAGLDEVSLEEATEEVGEESEMVGGVGDGVGRAQPLKEGLCVGDVGLRLRGRRHGRKLGTMKSLFQGNECNGINTDNAN